MNFVRFMDLVLYHPELGYYAKENSVSKIGRKGDFFTSVSVGSLFGKLLAQQFLEWWDGMGKPGLFYLIECGGLGGELARDILTELRKISVQCAECVHYIFVEPIPHLAECQKNKTSDFPRISWVRSLQDLKLLDGIVFGNELLDAFPFHILEKCNGDWKECCIALDGDCLTWTLQTDADSLGSQLPADYRGKVEICPQRTMWLEEAYKILRYGYVLLLDYGWTDEEYFQVGRSHGTVRAYWKHRYVENVLANLGEQDITAHVRWTPILNTAKHLGLKVEEFIEQGRWLSRILAKNPLPMDPREVRQFATLTHPELMGSSFRSLVLQKTSRN